MKDTFDKIVMDEKKKEEIRGMLQKKRAARPKWTIAVAAVAAAIALVMAIPATRKAVVNAAEMIAEHLSGTYRSKSGDEIKIWRDSSENLIMVGIDVEKKYPSEIDVDVKEGRLCFLVDGKWKDITDECSDSDYYRYECNNGDGSRSVICVGGTPNNYGWFEITYIYDNKTDLSIEHLLTAEYVNHGNCSMENPEKEWERKVIEDEKFPDDAPNAIGYSSRNS